MLAFSDLFVFYLLLFVFICFYLFLSGVLRCRIPGGGDRFWTVFGQVLGGFENVQSFKIDIDVNETCGTLKIIFLLAPLGSKGRNVVS